MGLSFFAIMGGKGGVALMSEIYRLIAAGIRPDCAEDTVAWYMARGDASGLETYINTLECRREVSDR